MRSLKLVLACVLVVGGWGCGDEGEGRKDAGDAGADARGDGGIDARDAVADVPVTPADGAVDAVGDVVADVGDAGACTLPACLSILSTQCIGSGACVQQSVTAGTSTTLSVCYANGVKERTFIDTSATVPIVVSVSQNGAACYSVEAVTSAGEQPQTLLTFKDNLGATIATGVRDSISGEVTITCVGQAPVQLGAGCPVGPSPAQVDGGTGTCTMGSCS